MYRDTKVQGLLDGNPPWPGQKLIDLGQGHRANFNLREGEGIVDAAKTPYYNLVFNVPHFAEVTFDVDDAEDYVLENWSNIFNEEYSFLLREWKGFDQNIQLSQWEMVVRGVGPMFWPHSISWQSQAIKSRKALVPQETFANVEQLELVAVLHSWRADELEKYIGGDATGENTDLNGWNVPLCRQAIINSFKSENRQVWGIENYDLYQRAIRSGDLFYGIHRSNRIYVATIFVKEFGGKVSQYTITDDPLWSIEEAYKDSDQEKGYLYKKRNKFDDFSQVICPFFYDTGPDGTWHTVKGLGPKIYDFCDVSNRTFCQMLDGMVIGSGLTLEAQDANSLNETQVTLIGGATVVSPGYKVTQTRVAEALQGAMAMRRELQNTLQSNTGSYRQRVADENHEPTLGQAQLNVQAQSLLSAGATNRFYNNLDLWHRETIRRILDPAAHKTNVPGGREARAFFERCAARGIPEEILSYPKIKSVTSVRNIGYGSQQMGDMITSEVMKMLPLMSEVGRNHACRMRASSIGLGPKGVDSIFPMIEKAGVPNDQEAMATLENNDLRMANGQVKVTPLQNHAIHFETHAQDVEQHMNDPRADPMSKYVHIENAGPHLQKHLMSLEGDPTRKKENKQRQERLSAISKYADKLKQNIEESLAAKNGNGQQPQQPPRPDPEEMKVHGELGLKAQKQKGEFALKLQKAGFEEQLKDKKAAAEIRRKARMPR